jgi:hypothetical protein
MHFPLKHTYQTLDMPGLLKKERRGREEGKKVRGQRGEREEGRKEGRKRGREEEREGGRKN